MTLCIGVKSPWGFAGAVYPPPGEPTTAVILAADSRWTFGEAPRDPKDGAQKLFTIDRNTAVAYAGVSWLAQRCIGMLIDLARKASLSECNLSIHMIQEELRRGYEKETMSKPPLGEECPVEFLIAKYEEPGGGDLFLLQSGSGFRLEKTKALETIGDPEAGQIFRKELRHIVRGPTSSGTNVFRSFSPSDLIASVAQALERVKTSDCQMPVGGWTQLLSIDSDGMRLWRASYNPDPTNQGPGWTSVTPQRGDIGTTEEML